MQDKHTTADNTHRLCLFNKLNIADFFHFVMLNLFQHPLFHCVNPEIPKQVRNDRGVQNDRERSSTLYETAEKEVQDTSCRGSGGEPQL